jgi:hypothetical protein
MPQNDTEIITLNCFLVARISDWLIFYDFFKDTYGQSVTVPKLVKDGLVNSIDGKTGE